MAASLASTLLTMALVVAVSVFLYVYQTTLPLPTQLYTTLPNLAKPCNVLSNPIIPNPSLPCQTLPQPSRPQVRHLLLRVHAHRAGGHARPPGVRALRGPDNRQVRRASSTPSPPVSPLFHPLISPLVSLGCRPCVTLAPRCTYPSASLALGRRHQMLQGQVTRLIHLIHLNHLYLAPSPGPNTWSLHLVHLDMSYHLDLVHTPGPYTWPLHLSPAPGAPGPQVYSIRMVLEVPDSPSNEELGMFMACMNITGTRGNLVTSACRSPSTSPL